MSTDAIVILRDDHRELKRVFREYRATTDQQSATRDRLARRMIELLTVHTYLENECMYPQVRVLLPDLSGDILESFEEHHLADVLCTELAVMDVADERFNAKVTVLMENVEHHIDEEEDGWFPQVREGLGRKILQEIGAEMVRMRADAPTHPAQPGAIRKALHAVLH